MCLSEYANHVANLQIFVSPVWSITVIKIGFHWRNKIAQFIVGK